MSTPSSSSSSPYQNGSGTVVDNCGDVTTPSSSSSPPQSTPAGHASLQQQGPMQRRIKKRSLRQQQQQQQAQRRRVFTLFPGNIFRFSLNYNRLLDALLDGMQSSFEGVVLLIGPLLILVALGIASLLTYTFWKVFLPMMLDKHADQSPLYVYSYLGLHCLWVAFILANVLYNYFYCVVTRNTGPRYDQVVRELAEATQFHLPKTLAEIESYRNDYEDKMILRIQRRREREQLIIQQQQQQEKDVIDNGNHDEEKGHDLSAANGGSDSLLLHRKKKSLGATAANNNKPAAAPAPPTNVRRWMLMGPYEWGYCHNTHQPKPPRSHYDHVTKQLVLNLDHYCPWVFNAIGYFNYRYFVNFLIYVFLGMVYGAILSFQPFVWLNSREFNRFSQRERIQARHDQLNGDNGNSFGHLPRPHAMFPHRDERMLVSLGFMLCAAVGLAVLLLAGFHIFLVLTAQTTIEFHGNFSKWRELGRKFRNPYSEGSWSKNWKRVYGDVFWLWALLPSAREPEYLPVPIPGQDTHRKRRREQSKMTREIDQGEAIPLQNGAEASNETNNNF